VGNFHKFGCIAALGALGEADVCHTAELDCGVDLHAPLLGRRFVIEVLDDCFGPGHPDDDTRGDIALVATELLTNAARVARAVVRLSVRVHRTWIEVVVTDDGPGRPQRRAASVADTSGRGLSIVDALASAWGVRMGGSSGSQPGLKSVWVRVEVAEDPTRELTCTQ
jgi:anti-sigma regulatory factor (Ser/Thr protein kinase)